MTDEDLDATVPVAAEADAQEVFSQSTEPSKSGDSGSTRDELWQVQFEPNAAREVAARHLGRLMYSSPDDWSHYVFHENDPKA
jgi:hypothetical protein